MTSLKFENKLKNLTTEMYNVATLMKELEFHDDAELISKIALSYIDNFKKIKEKDTKIKMITDEEKEEIFKKLEAINI